MTIMNMKMSSASGLVTVVKDLDKSKKFYGDLGFVFKKEMPGISATAYLNWFWIELLLETEVVSDEFKPDIKIRAKGAGQYMHIKVENVDDFYKGVVDMGYMPMDEPLDRPWGHREFILADPDGYKMVFFNKR